MDDNSEALQEMLAATYAADHAKQVELQNAIAVQNHAAFMEHHKTCAALVLLAAALLLFELALQLG